MSGRVFFVMVRPRLSSFLSFAIVFAMVIFIGNVNVSDAAQLWNKQDGKQKSGAYYNSQKSKSQSKGGTNLFNAPSSSKGHIGRASSHTKRLTQQLLQYENEQRAVGRIPNLYQYMSPYSVSNRLSDTEVALERKLQRQKETVAHLRKAYAELENSRSYEKRKKNHEKHVRQIASIAGFDAKYGGKKNSTSSRQSSSRAGAQAFSLQRERTESDDNVMTLDQGTKLYNSR